MSEENNAVNIENLDVMKYDEFVAGLSDADLKELANKICEILQNNPDYSSLEDNNTAGTKTKRDRVLEGTQEILNSMLRVANVAHKTGLEEDLRYKVPALRFGYLKELSFADKREEILESGKRLWDDYKIKIRLIKAIDSFDMTKDKYVIEFVDNNNNRVTIDYLEYQKKIYDFTVDEEQLLQDEIVKLRGTYDSDVVNAAKEAARYISLCLAFNEMLVYKYKYIGWQTIYHTKKDYLESYRADIDSIGEEFVADLVNSLLIDKNGESIYLYREIKEALHINIDDSDLSKRNSEGKKELIFKYDKLYARGENKERIGFCGERWANSIGAVVSEIDEDEKKFAFNTFFAHTFNNSTKASLVLCAAVSGIIRQMLDLSKEYGLNINIIGAAASGKSTLQNLVLSFFGNPTNLASSFLDTDAAKEEERVSRVFIPYVIDDKLLDSIDTSDNKRGADAFLDVFREYEGRIKQKSGLKNDTTHRFHGAIISSSVESIFDLIKKSNIGENDLGQVRRLIEIKIRKNDIFKELEGGKESASKQAETATEIARRYYGYGVPQIINYMFLMMKYQSLYHLLLSFKVNLENTFYLADKLIKIMEKLTDIGMNKKEIEKHINDLKDEFEELDIDNRLWNIVESIISNNITFGMDENDTKVFRRLLLVAESEMEQTIKRSVSSEYIDSMMPSKQRFSLINLTGYILNYAMSYTQIEDFEDVSMHMDMNKVTELLIENLIEKIKVHKAVNVDEVDTKEETCIKLINKKPTVQDIIAFYDWCNTNKNYFNIPNKNNPKEPIGRYKENHGNIEVSISTAGKCKLTLGVILSNLDSDGQAFVDYQYKEGSKLPNENKFIPTYYEEFAKTDETLMYVEKSKDNLLHFNRNYIKYTFFVSAIETAREALNQQAEAEKKTVETFEIVQEQSDEVVKNPVEEDNQGVETNETN
ncbi:MAG: hypothetical protein IKY94_05570 [Lachnospiraceae bacterium]|nr:hypothetical protein [Lachnospiraceae bacterium]